MAESVEKDTSNEEVLSFELPAPPGWKKKNQTPGDVPARRVSFEGGGHEAVDTRRCAAKDAGDLTSIGERNECQARHRVPVRRLKPEGGWTLGSVPTMTLGPEGGWIGGPTSIGEGNKCQRGR
ncbi:hypothetical protein SDJN02_17926, partial [Cucurbita argyrosperma subsp. argyrosperma]